jgi:hypothetical protein
MHVPHVCTKNRLHIKIHIVCGAASAVDGVCDPELDSAMEGHGFYVAVR